MESDRIHRQSAVVMATFRRGDHVKIELPDKLPGLKEWAWVKVDDENETRPLVFGRLDNQPIINTDLELGARVAVNFDKILDHRSFRDSQRG